jgi:hypothetical protein
MKNKGLLIAVGLGIVVGLTGWYFLVYKPRKDELNKKKTESKDDKDKTTTTGEGATNEQFDKLVKVMSTKGGDMFVGASAEKLSAMRNRFTSKLSKQEADKFIDIAGKKEMDWSASEKIDFTTILVKWAGKKPTS